MGAVFGAAVQRGGGDAILLDVDESLVLQIREHGLVLESGEESERFSVTAVTQPPRDPVDLVLVCVKSYHTLASAQLVAPAVGSETVVASLQNGWGNGDVLAAAFPAARIVVGVTYNSATVTGLGRVAHTGRGVTIVGPYTGNEMAAAQHVRDVLVAGGLEARADQGVRQEIWKKLILNAATLPPAAVTGLTAGDLGRPGHMRDLVDAVTREAVAVAQAEGYSIDAGERIALIHDVLVKAGDGKASMLQDLEAGRKTEIDVITGAVLAAAEAHNMPAPVNRALYAIVEALDHERRPL